MLVGPVPMLVPENNLCGKCYASLPIFIACEKITGVYVTHVYLSSRQM